MFDLLKNTMHYFHDITPIITKCFHKWNANTQTLVTLMCIEYSTFQTRSQNRSEFVNIMCCKFITRLRTHTHTHTHTHTRSGSFKHCRGQPALPESLCHVSGVLDFGRERFKHIILVQRRGRSVEEHSQRLQSSHAQIHTTTFHRISEDIFIS